MEEKIKSESTNKIIKTEEILLKQVELLEENSKDCDLYELRSNIDCLLRVLEFLFKYS